MSILQNLAVSLEPLISGALTGILAIYGAMLVMGIAIWGAVRVYLIFHGGSPADSLAIIRSVGGGLYDEVQYREYAYARRQREGAGERSDWSERYERERGRP